MDNITESSAMKSVKALNESSWQEMQDLYDKALNHQGKFFKLSEKKHTRKGASLIPYRVDEAVINEFRNYLYDKDLVIPFNWPEWDEGRAMFATKGEDKFSKTSLVDVLKLLTAVIRNDRFCEGAWSEIFNNGDGVLLMKRLLDFKPSNKS